MKPSLETAIDLLALSDLLAGVRVIFYIGLKQVFRLLNIGWSNGISLYSGLSLLLIAPFLSTGFPRIGEKREVKKALET